MKLYCLYNYLNNGNQHQLFQLKVMVSGKIILLFTTVTGVVLGGRGLTNVEMYGN